MPAISLGSAVQNWDMFFESYLSYFDQAQQSNHWAIGTDGYGDTNGFLLGFYDSGVTGNMSIAHPSGVYIYTLGFLLQIQYQTAQLIIVQ